MTTSHDSPTILDLCFDIIDFQDGTKRLKITWPKELEVIILPFDDWRATVRAIAAAIDDAEEQK